MTPIIAVQTHKIPPYLKAKISEKALWIFQVLYIRNKEPMLLMHVNHAAFYAFVLLITHKATRWIQQIIIFILIHIIIRCHPIYV
uniref:Uncharacterized protein n=1 Tax=Rhizophora mucronata TaxID=61149 RepID=A0A2P2KEX9_RHIMU